MLRFAVRIGGRLLFPLSQVVLVVAIDSRLGPNGSGTFWLAYSWTTVGALVATVGQDTLSARSTADGTESPRMLARRALVTSTAAAVLASLLLRLAAGQSGPMGDLNGMWPLALALVGMSLSRLLDGHLRGRGYPGLGGVALASGTLTLLVALTSPVGWTAPLAILALGTGGVIVFVSSTWWLARSSNAATNAPMSLDLRAGVHLLLYAAAGSAATYADVIILGFFSDAVTIGSYASVARIALLPALPLTVFSALFTRELRILGRSAQTPSPQMRRALRATIMCGMLAGAALLLGRPVLSSLLSSFELIPSMVLGALTLASLVNLISGPAAILLNLSHGERLTSRWMLGGATVNLIGNLVLVPFFDAPGAAVSTLCATMFWNGGLLLTCRRTLGIRSHNLTPLSPRKHP